MSAPYATCRCSIGELVLNDADAHPEEAIETAHPLRVPARQVVVHRDDVHALAFKGIEIGGKGGDESLALAGLHLGDLPGVQDHAANELHVEVPHVESAAAGFANDRERFREELVEGGALGHTLLQLAASFHEAVRR